MVLTGKESLGIEFGSTRIKAILVDDKCVPIASGSYTWENELKDGIWTYSLDSVWIGLQEAYKELNENVNDKFGSSIVSLQSIGISAMMHGYLPFDKDGKQLAEFRTWRNTITAQAAKELSVLFNFNIPQRWSIAHLYQAILNNESHVKEIDYLTTLAGYVHWKLTGEKILGIGEASGMFPIDSSTLDYNLSMISKFNNLENVKGLNLNLEEILPKVKVAGDSSSRLTIDGAKLIDPSGILKSGCILCPPEGDAGTGMVATKSIKEKTGNVSAGTSIFSMIVLEKELKNAYEQIDMVTTPTGKPVAMVHCNNCCSEIDAWVNLFEDLFIKASIDIPKYKIYDILYNEAFNAKEDCDNLVSYNLFSGEPVINLEDGNPVLIRKKDSKLNVANLFRSLIYSAMVTIRIGMDILDKENVTVESIMGHGGLFKTEKVGQSLMASAFNIPVSVMDTAGEGGAWGCAILASYASSTYSSLEDYLDNYVFVKSNVKVEKPNIKDVNGFNKYLDNYKNNLYIEENLYK